MSVAKEGKVLKNYCSLSWETLRDLKWVVLFVFPQVHLRRSTLLCSLLLQFFYLQKLNLNPVVQMFCVYVNIVKILINASSVNKTISDGGITVDFSIVKVHTSN